MTYRKLVAGCGLLVTSSLCVSADTEQVASDAMVPLEAGSFETAAGQELQVAPFAIGRSEVTRELWDTVREWAQNRGYDMRPGQGATSQHPVAAIDWYDAVKWCNALSEMQGMKPVYYTDTAHTEVYRSGEFDPGPTNLNWEADGFRLPTEAQPSESPNWGSGKYA